jgi:predicted CoA-binding protein
MISERDGLDDKEIRGILALRNIAVVGASRDPSKPAHYVPMYLRDHGYNIIPVNPSANEILGRRSSASLSDVVEQVDVVDIFRPSQDVLPIVREALSKGVKVVWMQEGIYNKEAADEARKHGVTAVWDRCMMKEHARLYGQKPLGPPDQQ